MRTARPVWHGAAVFTGPGQALRAFRDDSHFWFHQVLRNRGPCARITARASPSGTSRAAPQISL